MKQAIVWILVGLVIFMYLMLIFYRPSSYKSTDSQTLPQMTEKSVASQASLTSTGGKVVFARIENFQYTPRNIVIEQGTTVIWTNYDTEYHSVTSLQGYEIRSELLKFKEQYAKTFNVPGIYIYYCTMHPYIMGTVKVLDTV